MMKINKAGIIGTGAVGGMICSFLHKEYRDDFFVVGNEKRSRRVSNGLSVNEEIIYPVVINTEKEKYALDLVIICVKNYDLNDALKDLKAVTDEHTIILPLLNGVTATDVIQNAFPNNRVFYGIVMRTDAARVNYDVTFKACGEIQLGYDKNIECADEVAAVRDYLFGAGLNAVVYPDMLRMLWRKWMINIGANQVSVLTGAKFKYFGMFEEIVVLLRASMKEIVDIAKVKGIHLTEQDLEDVVQILINYPPEKKTSMLQDIEARRRTEIDFFAGTVMKYGEMCNVPTPINTMLYYGIKAREKVYLKEKEEELQSATVR
ncbi:MAG: 2-dehydropantoate 2-reductase [Lachnospiraceae bacterium]|nr:2-dehydropantoate 2-reductase [Lachnospiraceae bacterium]